MSPARLAVRPTPAEATQPIRGEVRGVEYFVVGNGGPVTLFAHGIGGSISETRPLATELAGTRVFLHFRGHQGSAPIPEGWDYPSLAEDIRAVADEVGATRAAGISMGAGALLRVVAEDANRFERLAFIMPAALTQARGDGAIERLHRMSDAVHAADEALLTELILQDVPAHLRSTRAPQLLAARRARDLLMIEPAHAKADVRPIEDLADLIHVHAPTLVLSQRDDSLHPAEIAQTLANWLPNSELVELAPGGVFWTEHTTARYLIAEHLTPGINK